MRFLWLCFVTTLLFTQDTIRVLTVGNHTVINEIEHELLKNIIELYNISNSPKMVYKFDTIQPFSVIFDTLNRVSQTKERDFILAISRVTKTPERMKHYDFSHSYVPVREVIIAKKGKSASVYNEWKRNGTPIGYQINTIQDKSVQRLKERFDIVPYPLNRFDEKVSAILENQLQFSIADNISAWGFANELHIVEELEFQQGSGVCILYPKGSPLLEKFDRYVEYYVHSERFFNLIRRKYSKDVSDYFRKKLK